MSQTAGVPAPVAQKVPAKQAQQSPPTISLQQPNGQLTGSVSALTYFDPAGAEVHDWIPEVE